MCPKNDERAKLPRRKRCAEKSCKKESQLCDVMGERQLGSGQTKLVVSAADTEERPQTKKSKYENSD